MLRNIMYIIYTIYFNYTIFIGFHGYSGIKETEKFPECNSKITADLILWSRI